MDTRFAISEYNDAVAVNKELDELIKKPIYTIKPEALKKYEDEYYNKKCLWLVYVLVCKFWRIRVRKECCQDLAGLMAL